MIKYQSKNLIYKAIPTTLIHSNKLLHKKYSEYFNEQQSYIDLLDVKKYAGEQQSYIDLMTKKNIKKLLSMLGKNPNDNILINLVDNLRTQTTKNFIDTYLSLNSEKEKLFRPAYGGCLISYSENTLNVVKDSILELNKKDCKTKYLCVISEGDKILMTMFTTLINHDRIKNIQEHMYILKNVKYMFCDKLLIPYTKNKYSKLSLKMHSFSAFVFKSKKIYSYLLPIMLYILVKNEVYVSLNTTLKQKHQDAKTKDMKECIFGWYSYEISVNDKLLSVFKNKIKETKDYMKKIGGNMYYNKYIKYKMKYTRMKSDISFRNDEYYPSKR